MKCTQKTQVESDVLRPLAILLQMLHGPNKVIKKRRDKLLDYDSAMIKLRGNRDAESVKVVSVIFTKDGSCKNTLFHYISSRTHLAVECIQCNSLKWLFTNRVYRSNVGESSEKRQIQISFNPFY